MRRGTSVEGLPIFPLNVELKLDASTVVPFLNHLMGTLKKKKSGVKFWGGGGERSSRVLTLFFFSKVEKSHKTLHFIYMMYPIALWCEY